MSEGAASAPVALSRASIAVDAHAIEGKPQGIQTTIIRLLNEIGAAGRASDFSIFCSDLESCRSRLGAYPFNYVRVTSTSSIKRLVATLPLALRRNKAKTAIWQYISSPFFFGRNIVFIHDVLPYTHPQLFPLIFRLRCQIFFFLSMLFASRILTVSEFSRSELGRLFPFFTSKIEVIHNGPSFDRSAYFEEAPPAGLGQRYLLAVGRIESRKNIKLLVDAFINADLHDVRLIVVGRADLGYVAQFPSDPRIDIRSDVDDSELVELYKGASLFVFPSVAEGFGLPILDATLFGVPSICSNQTAMPDVAGDMAQFFDPTLPDAEQNLASLIHGHFHGRPIPAPSMEQRQSQSERFSWQSSAAKLLSVLDGLDRRQ